MFILFTVTTLIPFSACQRILNAPHRFFRIVFRALILGSIRQRNVLPHANFVTTIASFSPGTQEEILLLRAGYFALASPWSRATFLISLARETRKRERAKVSRSENVTVIYKKSRPSVQKTRVLKSPRRLSREHISSREQRDAAESISGLHFFLARLRALRWARELHSPSKNGLNPVKYKTPSGSSRGLRSLPPFSLPLNAS